MEKSLKKTEWNPITFAKSVLRRASKKTRGYNEVLAKAKYIYYPVNKDGMQSKAYRTSFECAICHDMFQRNEIEVDHIVPIAFSESIEEWIRNLYCDAEHLQVICKVCHKKKSKLDRQRIIEWKKQRKNSSDPSLNTSASMMDGQD